MKRTATITLTDVKDSDGWYELGLELGKTEEEISGIFEYGEYGSVEIIIDEDLNVVGGRVIPYKK